MSTPIQALKSKNPTVMMETKKRWLRWNSGLKKYEVWDHAAVKYACVTKDLPTGLDFLLGKR